MVQHRAQRRDAAAAGDEEEAAFGRRLGELERAERAFDVDANAGREIGQMRAGRPVFGEANQELEASITRGLGGADRDRVGPALSRPCGRSVPPVRQRMGTGN